jgi:hypothetical protein
MALLQLPFYIISLLSQYYHTVHFRNNSEVVVYPSKIFCAVRAKCRESHECVMRRMKSPDNADAKVDSWL